jgi:hypothetical protein
LGCNGLILSRPRGRRLLSRGIICTDDTHLESTNTALTAVVYRREKSTRLNRCVNPRQSEAGRYSRADSKTNLNQHFEKKKTAAGSDGYQPIQRFLTFGEKP